MESLKQLFFLQPDIHFLNHGSFGACPRPVFDVYQMYQRRLEEQPVKFIVRDLPHHFLEARRALAAYINVPADDLVFVPNDTFAVNIVARSLALAPGDEVLATDHEYGACDRIWRFVCRQRGASYVRQPVKLPVESQEAIVEQVWQGVTPRTRIIFVSHITSSTALRIPVAAICRRAREAGILTVVDGAHAPGQIALDVAAVDADFYTGNCHKWLMAPKGAGFLYARPEKQSLLDPLVISWGWESDTPGESQFLDYHQWWGTRDPAASLAVPAAIQFQEQYDWPNVRTHCHELAVDALEQIGRLTGLAPLYPAAREFFEQMFIAPLPPCDVDALKRELYDRHHIEIPVLEWQERPLLRVSLQGYNDEKDVDALLEALEAELPA